MPNFIQLFKQRLKENIGKDGWMWRKTHIIALQLEVDPKIAGKWLPAGYGRSAPHIFSATGN